LACELHASFCQLTALLSSKKLMFKTLRGQQLLLKLDVCVNSSLALISQAAI
tara:strand:+ start:2942 stop:3097 length:156 start_codon:yes stop_codon:yes gene_type:complete